MTYTENKYRRLDEMGDQYVYANGTRDQRIFNQGVFAQIPKMGELA